MHMYVKIRRHARKEKEDQQAFVSGKRKRIYITNVTNVTEKYSNIRPSEVDYIKKNT